ncbi:uncharacterized protein [Dermacentor albipictus]|uniref:uncharacterized protein isoform X2 n=1 Tax=Dermacentor albipictus TaxID=60249 RepID=UPI0038FD0A11
MRGDSTCFCHKTDASAAEAPKQPWLKKARTETRLLRLRSVKKQRRAQARNSSKALRALPMVAIRHTHVPESGITSSPPMASSSSCNHAQPSTSHAGTEEASAIPENIASIADEAWKYQWNTQPTPITGGTCNIDGVTDNGSTSYQHLRTISSIDNARPSSSLAGMEEGTASFEDYATCRNATGTGGRELQELGGVCGNVPSGRSALHGYPMEPTGDTANIYKASGFVTTPSKTSGSCSTASMIPRTVRAIHMSLKAESPVPHLWRPAVSSITHSPVQAALAWRKHRPFRKTLLGMQLEPEKGNRECPAVSVEKFPADGAPHMGTPSSTRAIEPPR